jgi:hypothetical protein
LGCFTYDSVIPCRIRKYVFICAGPGGQARATALKKGSRKRKRDDREALIKSLSLNKMTPIPIE